jgi:hypothetical protein
MFTKGTPGIWHQTTKRISKQLPNSKSSSVRTGMESLALQTFHPIKIIGSSPCSLARPCKHSSYLPVLHHSCCKHTKARGQLHDSVIWHANVSLLKQCRMQLLRQRKNNNDKHLPINYCHLERHNTAKKDTMWSELLY